MSEQLAFATAMAREGGALIRSGRDSPLEAVAKPNQTRVTWVDTAINRLFIRAVRHAFPGHAVMGEEESYGDESGKDVWIIDPLDGTDRYIDGEDSCTIGIAKRTAGQLELGVVYNPFTDEMYSAARGQGAFLNGRRIHVGTQTLTPGVAYDYCTWPGASPDASLFDERLGAPLDYNSVLYKACKVAEGVSAFVVFPGKHVHDAAAADPIVIEAGGRVTKPSGAPMEYGRIIGGAVFSNGIVHDEVLAAIHGAPE